MASIILDKNSLSFESTGGTATVNVDYVGAKTVGNPFVSDSWILLEETERKTGIVNKETVVTVTYSVTVENNISERNAYITFSMVTPLGMDMVSEYLQVEQSPLYKPIYPDLPFEPELPFDPDIPVEPDYTDVEVTYSPIWRDVEYTFVGDDVTYGIYQERKYTVQGQLYKEDVLLFKGKAYASPESTQIVVNINKICQNYMSEAPNIFEGSTGIYHSYNEFKLKDENGNVLHIYRFVNDWSYKPIVLGMKTNPIFPYIGDGQKLFFSVFEKEKEVVEWGLTYKDGTTYENSDYVENEFKTNIVRDAISRNVKEFNINGRKFDVLPKCKCQYVLYYLNPYGGFDWFVITGRVIRNDNINRYTVTQNYNNTTTEFGKKCYISSIAISYQINTQWLSQEQSNRMWELLESNVVWLHSLEDDTIYPVVIKDNNVEHKQKTRNKKLISYQFNVELSQGRERM
jgi:hypothetical protein